MINLDQPLFLKNKQEDKQNVKRTGFQSENIKRKNVRIKYIIIKLTKIVQLITPTLIE